MVARGNNRNNGSNLGIAYLNANNALSNSNGNNWRSRPTFTPCAARPPRLYRGIWRRTRRAFCVFSAHPTKRLYLSLMSRKGWLMAINKHFSPVFKLPNGGYLWQAR